MSGRDARGARPVGEIVADYLRASGLRQRMKQGHIVAAWERVVGGAVARHARVCGLRRHVLRLEVDSAAMLQELAGFRKAEILARLAAELPGVHIADLRFALARFEERPD